VKTAPFYGGGGREKAEKNFQKKVIFFCVAIAEMKNCRIFAPR
jgi:hypothetical protein